MESRHLVFYLLAVSLLYCVDCETVHDHIKLHDYLLSTTTKRVPPKFPILVEANFNLGHIIDLDMSAQVMTAMIAYNYEWECGLAWNTSDFGGVKTTFLENDDIWTPVLDIYNSVDDFSIMNASPAQIRCSDKGWCSQFVPKRVAFSCSVDLEYYPRDDQSCLIHFMWDYHMSEAVIQLSVSDLKEFYPHSELKVTKIAGWSGITPNSTFQHKYVNISMTRNPTYISSTLVLPMIMIGLITACGFLLPSDGDIKINVQLMALLTQAVYMSILSDKLSASAKPPMLVTNLAWLMFMSAIGIVVSLISYRTINRATSPPPALLLKVMSKIGLVVLAGKLNTSVSEMNSVDNLDSSPVKMIQEETELSSNVKTITEIIKSVENQKDSINMWSYIALVIDRIFFIGILVTVGLIVPFSFRLNN